MKDKSIWLKLQKQNHSPSQPGASCKKRWENRLSKPAAWQKHSAKQYPRISPLAVAKPPELENALDRQTTQRARCQAKHWRGDSASCARPQSGQRKDNSRSGKDWQVTMKSIALCADSMPARMLKGIKSVALNCLQTITGYAEPSLAQANAYDEFQFERHGYFVADRVDHKVEIVVFKKIAGLKDTWAK